MTDKKLTDEEIKKALECCSKAEIYADCEKMKCPLFLGLSRGCKYVDNENQLYSDALDLFTRQQAENENLKVENQSLRTAGNSLKMHYEEAQTEVERLQNILICFMDALGKVRKVDDIDEISLIPLMSELNKQYRAELKAEAYKEFAERVKEFMHNKFKTLDEYEFEYITERDIDNLLKEIEGDDNA